MKSARTTLVGLLLVALVAGCAPTMLYNYGSYSRTLYKYRKDSSAENLQKHMSELNRLIAYAEKGGKPVPPGLHGELGYFYLLTDDPATAEQHFRAEVALYPESGILMNRMLETMTAKTGETAPHE